MVVLGVIGLIVLAIVLYALVIGISAYLFSTYVPVLIEDPSNFGAWIWTVVGVIIVVSLATYRAKDSK